MLYIYIYIELLRIIVFVEVRNFRSVGHWIGSITSGTSCLLLFEGDGNLLAQYTST